MFDPEIADIRFGTGLSPRHKPPQSADAMLNGLVGPDAMGTAFPISPFDDYRQTIVDFYAARRIERRAKTDADRDAARKDRRKVNRAAQKAFAEMIRATLLRRINTRTGFRERLAFFWSDHFTAKGKANVVRFATSPYIEEAIRPNIAGKFEDLLIASVTHPLMLHFLDQNKSVGPNSKRGKRRDAGLNENLAREVLELHTLGVDGPYTQADVRQLAELFAGLSMDSSSQFSFNRSFVEPGVETVLGRDYGRAGKLEDVHAVLRDLARHPATAGHVARKLAQHFVGDDPDPDLVAHMASAYVDSDGDLLRVYVALLDHPASWATAAQNVKPPIDFVASALRALDPPAAHLTGRRAPNMRDLILTPLQIMGQPWEAPDGPDGWPEDNSYWIAPQFLAARLAWALSAPQAYRPDLPDPRDFARTALGKRLPEDVAFAASAAENRWEGIALVLAAPAFQKH